MSLIVMTFTAAELLIGGFYVTRGNIVAGLFGFVLAFAAGWNIREMINEASAEAER